jgi:hypothetical protein
MRRLTRNEQRFLIRAFTVINAKEDAKTASYHVIRFSKKNSKSVAEALAYSSSSLHSWQLWCQTGSALICSGLSMLHWPDRISETNS